MTNTPCPCGAARSYETCCGLYIDGGKPAPTAEALMRSRYSAYVKTKMAYLRDTLAPRDRGQFDEAGAKKWATESQWKGLTILATERGGTADDEGTVTFVARYLAEGAEREHREQAVFRRDPQTKAWYFDEARTPKAAPVVREAPKVGRNDPCSCGSGKKFKKCCGA
ncbi:MAG: YchJ family protein [Elusimicrobia bacterium]|nr:YchJ family protein [Elusimicrobiota bacterium]